MDKIHNYHIIASIYSLMLRQHWRNNNIILVSNYSNINNYCNVHQMWMSALRELLIVLICVITSMVATTAAAQDQAIDYKVITLPVKVSHNKVSEFK